MTMQTEEIAAGTAALKEMIASKLPAWQQRLVPDDLLNEAVAVVVGAVDKVRDTSHTVDQK